MAQRSSSDSPCAPDCALALLPSNTADPRRHVAVCAERASITCKGAAAEELWADLLLLRVPAPLHQHRGLFIIICGHQKMRSWLVLFLLSCSKGKAEVSPAPGISSNVVYPLQQPTPCSAFKRSQMPNTVCQCSWMLPSSFKNTCNFLLKKSANIFWWEYRLNLSFKL